MDCGMYQFPQKYMISLYRFVYHKFLTTMAGGTIIVKKAVMMIQGDGNNMLAEWCQRC